MERKIDTLNARQKALFGIFADQTAILSFDADGILINSAHAVTHAFNRKYNTSFTTKNITNWYSLVDWSKSLGFGDAESSEIALNIWNDPKVIGDSGPMPGALETCFSVAHFLGEDRLHVITSRPASLRQITFDWFNYWMPWIPKRNIHIRDSDSVTGENFKVNKISEIKVSVHVEDAAHQAQPILDGTNAWVYYIPTMYEEQLTHAKLLKPDTNSILSLRNDFEIIKPLVAHY